MRAVVLREHGEPERLVLENIPDPSPAADEVLVRVRASSVCGRDLIDRRGGFPMMKMPAILGHEMAGEVVRVGAAVKGFSPGDRVVNLQRPSCGACRRCLEGEPVLCEGAWQSLGLTVDGAYAEQVITWPRGLVKLPAAIPFDVGSTLMCTAGVALRALRGRAELEVGETLLITGASGGVGQAAVQIARHMGARVVVTTTSPDKVEELTKLGAHHVVVSEKHRFSDDVLKAVGQVDAALDLVGAPTIVSALRCLRMGGRMVVLGNIELSKVDLNPGMLIVRGLSILGGVSCSARDLTDVFAMVESGALVPRIDRRLPLDRAAEAHRLLAERKVVGRVVLEP
ncbi:Alcohol dehydrogenase [Minicystis rosea]|nr:Alcohol dehydrogenase [Minicystis rosea]